MAGWYDGAINGLIEARNQEKVFIWLDDYDNMFEHEDELRDRLGDTECEEDLSDLLYRGMEGDPDKFNYDGEVVSYYTLENCRNKKQYIIIATCYELDAEARRQIEESLTMFYGEDRSEKFSTFEPQNWDAFGRQKGKMVVAFRGGYGYNYDLWVRNEFKADMQEA